MSNCKTISTTIRLDLLEELDNAGFKRNYALEVGANFLLGKRTDYESFKQDSGALFKQFEQTKRMVVRLQLQVMMLGNAFREQTGKDPLLESWEKMR